jgi:hypothetical protein
VSRIDATAAQQLVRLILPSLHREYPTKLAHVLHGDADARPARELTPMFYGSFDWHSSVHSHWSLLRLLRLYPDAGWAIEVSATLDRSFTDSNARGELTYLEDRPGFEMPYGLAWLLQLACEAGRWRSVIAPLESLAARRFADWLPKLSHPIRSGEHTQSAFAMGLTLDYAAPVSYEPSAYDFLSPSLAEADLMRRVLSDDELAAWLAGFLPSVDGFRPVAPVDRADGKLAHFDGLNLSRAWMLRALGHRELAEAHAAAGLAGVTDDHYAGAHWLGSFALYWLTG